MGRPSPSRGRPPRHTRRWKRAARAGFPRRAIRPARRSRVRAVRRRMTWTGFRRGPGGRLAGRRRPGDAGVRGGPRGIPAGPPAGMRGPGGGCMRPRQPGGRGGGGGRRGRTGPTPGGWCGRRGRGMAGTRTRCRRCGSRRSRRRTRSGCRGGGDRRHPQPAGAGARRAEGGRGGEGGRAGGVEGRVRRPPHGCRWGGNRASCSRGRRMPANRTGWEDGPPLAHRGTATFRPNLPGPALKPPGGRGDDRCNAGKDPRKRA